jgi:hypothetical protein
VKTIKRSALFLGLLLIVFIAWRLAAREDVNARVERELRAEPRGAAAKRMMLVMLADGRTLPVNYLREKNLVFMGVDGRWWRIFTGDGAPIELLIQGETLKGHATTVLDDQDYVDIIFRRLRPRVPGWVPGWLNGKLVVVELDG